MDKKYKWLFMTIDEIIDFSDYEKGSINDDRTNDDETCHGPTKQSSEYT